MFCPKCGSEMDEGWVACPRCGHRWADVALEKSKQVGLADQSIGWYPNRRQWWTIWITAFVMVVALLNGADGVVFAFCAALIGALLVWRLQRSGERQ